MKQSQGTIGQQIAREAQRLEKRQTRHGRKWVAVFMNEDTIVIALHGSLTAAEKALAQSLAGAAQVREFHRRLFTSDFATLEGKIKKITGMEVGDTTAEIDPRLGSVVQLFTTTTASSEGYVTGSVLETQTHGVAGAAISAAVVSHCSPLRKTNSWRSPNSRHTGCVKCVKAE